MIAYRGMPKITAKEREHLERVRGLPCLPCSLEPGLYGQAGPTEAQHVVSGNRRLGHYHCYPLCSWHHRAVVKDGTTKAQMRAWFGPSLADGSKPFHQRYGTEAHLVAHTNKQLEVKW